MEGNKGNQEQKPLRFLRSLLLIFSSVAPAVRARGGVMWTISFAGFMNKKIFSFSFYLKVKVFCLLPFVFHHCHLRVNRVK
jgi:hypothetical protein